MTPTTPCDQWPGRLRKEDGRAIAADGRNYAYRVAWEAAHGPLAPGVVLHHECGNPGCVRLDHLTPTGQGAHLLSHGLAGDWGQADKTHCPAGHPYAGDNLYVWRRDGREERRCRECGREAKRRYRARLRAAAGTL